MNMRMQIKTVSVQITAMKSTHDMTKAMGKCVGVMKRMNEAMPMGAIQQMMGDFQKAAMQMNLTGEALDEAIDEAFEDESEDEEVDNLVSSVFDELNLNIDAPEADKTNPNEVANKEKE